MPVCWTALPGAVRRRRRLERRLRALAPQVVCGARPDEARGAALAFGLVHYEAPDFLHVALGAVAAHHPDAPVTVLDNGSCDDALAEAEAALAACPRATLLRGHGDKPRHTVALQALFDRALAAGVRTVVFLDQDAMLLRPVDGLRPLLEEGALLVGARDAVRLPRDDGPLSKGWMRSAPLCVHPSFLLLEPRRVAEALGPRPFAEHPLAARAAQAGGWEPEPYHGIAMRALPHVQFLETRVSDALPPLTFYEVDGHAYACHAWYSARTTGHGDDDTVDGLPVGWLRARRAAVLAWMRNAPATSH
jgi:hypothetical protein